MEARRLLLTLVLVAQLAAFARARPGPMLRGTVIIMHGRPQPLFSSQPLPWAVAAGSELADASLAGPLRPLDRMGEPRFEGIDGSVDIDASLLDRLFATSSVFGPPLRMFEGQPGGIGGGPLDPPRRRRAGPCPFARRGGAPDDELARHMASARFGPDLLSTLLAVAQADEDVSSDTSAPSITSATEASATAGEERRLRGDAGAVFTFRDFVHRRGGGAFPSRVQAAAARKSAAQAQDDGCSKLHRFPGLEAACRMRLPWEGLRPYGIAHLNPNPRAARPAASQLPALSWELYSADGQLNGSVLVFCLLVIACVAVWARLLVLWCTWRGAGCFGRRRRCRRRFGCRRAAPQADPVKEGLEAPLLNPLAHEAPVTGTEAHGVESAAAYTAPAARYVTLQYVQLRGDA